MRITILGFGLIGGSIARALAARREPQRWRVTAWSRTPDSMQRAVADGVLEHAAITIADAVRGADLILLAAPPLVCLELLDQLSAMPVSATRGRDPEATITDVASVKSALVKHADDLRLPFLGGHPMAGREVTGYGASTADLFAGRPWVTVAGRCARLQDAERVEELIDACGAIQVRMTAEAHDSAVAAISHMPLVLSAALVEAVVGGPAEPDRADWVTAHALAATGWAGMTRLARGDPAMGAGIAATNAPAIAARLRDVRAALDSWIVLLEQSGAPDAAALLDRFEAARRRLDTDP